MSDKSRKCLMKHHNFVRQNVQRVAKSFREACWKKKVEPKRLQGGAVFMSTGWPPSRYSFSTTLQSGTVFYQKKGWLWLHFLRWSHYSSTSKKGTVLVTLKGTLFRRKQLHLSKQCQNSHFVSAFFLSHITDRFALWLFAIHITQETVP